MSLGFNANALPVPHYEYVAWVDVMGIAETMKRSENVAANFMCKVHIAALQAPRKAVKLYPVMDGFYAAASELLDIKTFLVSVFAQISCEFTQETKQHFRFIIRGALAFGPTYHGQSFTNQVSRILAQNPSHKDSLMLGVPMIRAHENEVNAPPFGIYLDSTIRSMFPRGNELCRGDWWRWFNSSLLKPGFHANSFFQSLQAYYGYYRANSASLKYPIPKINNHEQMARSFFI